MRRVKRNVSVLLTAILLMGEVLLLSTKSWGYSTASTYDKGTKSIVFKKNYGPTPHSWFIIKAIELLRTDGHTYEADIAEIYLLPMVEGVGFVDTWGDSDYDGSQILHYYCPGRPDQNYGFGSAFVQFANPTWDYAGHSFYGYENAAEYAQDRYEAAKRAALGQWGSDPQDHMAGWVADKLFGQDDPLDGRWANGTADIDDPKHRFGSGQTPRTALTDLLVKWTDYQFIFPYQHPEPFLSKIYVPKWDVFGQSPRWLDERFNDADDIETYVGYDGHGSVIYAAWTLDTGSPIVFYVPANSNENAFFLLGWAIHLVQDCTLSVHTVDSSWTTYQVHLDIEHYSNDVLKGVVDWNGKLIEGSLWPALTQTDFTALYQWPPPKGDYSGLNPASDYKQRWYSDNLAPKAGEEMVHAYAREAAETANKYMQFIESINTEDDRNWPVMGCFTALELDLAIKATAGIIHKFFSEVGMIKREIYDGNGGPLCSTELPYLIASDVTVPAGKTLTICPGVTVRFKKGAKITAHGTLNADGRTGTIKFICDNDNTKGMKISSQFVLKDEGELKMCF